ncbi:MAG: bifunctional tetrahydrofolate synthase/dihydrofolate synthase [Gammaproteobacteria bacterium]
MKFNDLDSWLRWQETLYPRSVELGLARPRQVYRRLPPLAEATTVISVAGTNGKGSTVAVLECLLTALGRSVASFSSPHLFRYNERIRFDGVPVSDRSLMEAFQRVEDARQGGGLTYFEFGALAALTLIAERAPDVAVLEVGMGGRLDAVNLIDADIAVITSVGLDHQAWLGPDRESIGREKAGILRAGRPLVLGDRKPPDSVLSRAEELGTPVLRLGRDFDFVAGNEHWCFNGKRRRLRGLPVNLLGGPLIGNASCALQALEQLDSSLLQSESAVATGLSGLTIPGRLQVIPGDPEWVIDLAHNPDGARELAKFLGRRPARGRTTAVFGMLADKDIGGVAAEMRDQVDQWIVAGLDGERGATATEIAAQVASAGVCGLEQAASVPEAVQMAQAAARPGDRIVAFGSFHLVAPVMERLGLYSAVSEHAVNGPENSIKS